MRANCLCICASFFLSAPGMTLASTGDPPAASNATTTQHVTPRASITDKLAKTITADFKNQRLEDIITFIAKHAGVEIESMWLSDRHAIGMDKNTLITLKATNLTCLELIERVLTAAGSDSTGAFGMTWQVSGTDTLQIGPRERLNDFRRVQVYDISDLLAIVPDFTNAPGFDLNAILQSQNGRGGGSAQSPFTPANRGTSNQPGTGVSGLPENPKSQRAQELRFLIIQLIETEQWEESGSDAASIRFYQGSFIVNAPEYIHRALAGSNRSAQ